MRPGWIFALVCFSLVNFLSRPLGAAEKPPSKVSQFTSRITHRAYEYSKNKYAEIRELKSNLSVIVDAKRHPGENINFVMASLGDSLTTATNATFPFVNSIDLNYTHHHLNLNPVDHHGLSWATGHYDRNLVDSHFFRLQRLNLGNIVAVNVARHATTSDFLDGQITEVFKHYAPNYVTILSGANDVCKVTNNPAASVARYEANITRAIERLRKKRVGVKVLLVGIPNLEIIYSLGAENSTCRSVWAGWRFCRSLLSAENSAAARQQLYERWRAMNVALRNIADRYPQNVKYSGKPAEFSFKKEHVSKVDCFHPSAFGQHELARVTWEEGWYARE